MDEEEKAKIRANQVHLKVVQSLDLSDPYQAQLDQLVQAVSTDEDFAEVTASEPIKERVRLFFSALLTIQAQLKQQRPTAPAHALLFFNTFRQMKARGWYPPCVETVGTPLGNVVFGPTEVSA